MAVARMDALCGRRSGSQNASPRTSRPGHSFAGFVLTKSQSVISVHCLRLRFELDVILKHFKPRSY